MSQLVETGQGVAEFPDEMSHDEIAGVIKKQFYSPQNPPPAEIKSVHSAKAENAIAGIDQAPTYPSKANADPLTENMAGAASDIAEGLVGSVKALPGMVWQGVKATSGVSRMQREGLTQLLSDLIPMGKQMSSDLESPLGSRESFRGIGQAALMAAPGLEFLRGVRGVPKVGSLEAKLAPISGEAPPVQKVPLAPVESVKPEKGLAKPETQTPQEELNQGTGGLDWQYDKGSDIQAPLSYAGDYVISHRPNQFTLSYRPTGEHNPLGQFQTLEEAKSVAEQHASLVPEATQAPVESGLQAKPELPENVEVTIKASTSKGEPLEVKMDAREAEKVLNERKTALENLIDCLGA